MFIEEYVKLHPVDLADRLLRLSDDERADLLTNLPRENAAAALAELYEDQFEEVTKGLDKSRLVELVGELEHDDAADILGEIEEEKREELLDALPDEVSAPIEELLQYEEDTAGGIMSDRFFTLGADEKVEDCQRRLRETADRKRDDISYLYVVDDATRLVGVVPLRELVFAKPTSSVEEVMDRDIKFLRVDDDQEQVARRFENYGYMGLPVLDKVGALVGVVHASEAFEVAQEEATEDMQLMVGLSGEERSSTPWSTSITRRLPWLCVNLLTAFMAAVVVAYFESTISALPVLAVFLGVIAGQGGNAGMQTLTVIIRDLALGELEPGEGRKVLFKEILLGVINGIAIGVIVGAIGWFWKGSPEIGIVAGVAMLLSMVAAAMFGVLIPFGLKALRIDPALASSIFLTTITDIAGFFIFLGLATKFILKAQ
ncbi:MAG: magnesium transporter [Limisphaerales bacterium]